MLDTLHTVMTKTERFFSNYSVPLPTYQDLYQTSFELRENVKIQCSPESQQAVSKYLLM